MKKIFISVLLLIPVLLFAAGPDADRDSFSGKMTVTTTRRINMLTQMEFDTVYNKKQIKLKSNFSILLMDFNDMEYQSQMMIDDNKLQLSGKRSTDNYNNLWSTEYELDYNGQKSTGVIEMDQKSGVMTYDIDFAGKKISGSIDQQVGLYQLQFGDKKITGKKKKDSRRKRSFDISFGDKKITGHKVEKIKKRIVRKKEGYMFMITETKFNMLLEDFSNEELFVFMLIFL